ncbi:sigma 54-interacting transcriptional regulator [Paraburkholderia fungorum]|uniref:sigma 54-interacting transcriptional regulator n=1 Tax=Paraburkholderia fungorum TaxID=134537 RepID=UPI003C6E4D54
MLKGKLLNLPPDSDLRRLIHFSPDDGQIWLAGQRMLLIHASALGGLRLELIHSVGMEHTRRYFSRIGYAAGKQDATLVSRVRGGKSDFDMLTLGIQLHMLEGLQKVTPLSMDFDLKDGQLHGEFRCDHSWEAETHKREFGLQHEPVCWMLIGYASGYTSAFMRRSILFKETSCAACGGQSCHFVGKPAEEWADAEEMASYFDPTSLLSTIQNLQTEVESLRFAVAPEQNKTELVGQSAAFKAAYELLTRAASTQVTVLLTGETGVGKERFARALHAQSRRADKPFVAVNCAAIPHDLIESELFGAEKGAYTGSHTTRAGRFERADGGTLFLDEIGELPLQAQAKLLRVIQESEVERLGATQTRKVDVRLVAATNQELDQAVREGRFRADLYYRINVYPVVIPPLRERREDIEALVRAALERFALLHSKPVPMLTDHAFEAMRNYTWPGNVRELENLVERAIILSKPNETVDAQDLLPNMSLPDWVCIGTNGRLAQRKASLLDCGPLLEQLQRCGEGLEGLERELLYEAVEKANGNISAAARLLGLTRAQLAHRLSRYQDTERADT